MALVSCIGWTRKKPNERVDIKETPRHLIGVNRQSSVNWKFDEESRHFRPHDTEVATGYLRRVDVKQPWLTAVTYLVGTRKCIMCMPQFYLEREFRN